MENERKTRTVVRWGPGSLGLGQTMTRYEFEEPIPDEEPVGPGPKRDNLRTRIADTVTGTNTATPKILAVLKRAHASGTTDLTDKEIVNRINDYPEGSLISIFSFSDRGIRRALRKLTEEGVLQKVHFTAEQAVNQPGTYPGDNYSTPYFPEAEIIYEASSEQPQDLDLKS